MLTIFEWRKAFMSPSGPESTTRLVLLAISTHMTIEGKSAFPSYECLARETGLSTRSVGEHVRRAEAWGWLRREEGLAGPSGWPRVLYYPAIPPGPHEERRSSTPRADQERPAAAAGTSCPTGRNHVPTNSSLNSSKNSSTCVEEDTFKNGVEGFEKFRRKCNELFGKQRVMPDDLEGVFKKMT
jgi:Helix-turn-helix domain